MTTTTTIHTCEVLTTDGERKLRACLHIQQDGVLTHELCTIVDLADHPSEAAIRARLASVRDGVLAAISTADAIAAALTRTTLE